MLTKKDFKELAGFLAKRRLTPNGGGLENDIANFCYRNNTKFDRGRFADAIDDEAKKLFETINNEEKRLFGDTE